MSKYLDALAKHQGRHKNDVLKYAETIEEADIAEVGDELQKNPNTSNSIA